MLSRVHLMFARRFLLLGDAVSWRDRDDCNETPEDDASWRPGLSVLAGSLGIASAVWKTRGSGRRDQWPTSARGRHIVTLEEAGV
jgi:hypothetical protein